MMNILFKHNSKSFQVCYLRIILISDRQMDFTDIIKFFNEMAEKHEAVQVLDMARQLVSTLQAMMADK